MARRAISGLIGLGLCLMTPAFAQEFRATISGHVYDSSGGAIPNATVTAKNVGTNETNTATSNSSGAYTIPFLRPGNYQLTASASGFKQYVQDNLVLQVSQVAGVEITLEVGQVSEKVEVTAESALLETQTASRGNVVSTQQVAELPLNARNPFMLGSMASGVTFRGSAIWQRPFDNGAIAEWSVNGGRQSNNEFLLDGAPNNAQAGGNNVAYVPIVDAVQEFNVQSNSYDAQYGKTGGGVFNVILKSGTNTFHATGWEYLRRTPLDANTFQNNSRGAPRTEHTLDQYGFQLEGPVYIPKLLKKDGAVKLFYLGSFENYRESTPTPLLRSYPEAEMRTGDFSKLTDANGNKITIYDPATGKYDANGNWIRSPFPDNKIPTNRIDPVAANVSKYMPLPNYKTPGQRYATQNVNFPNYFANDKFYNLILKFDWNFGDRHRAFFRHASNDRTEERNDNAVFTGPGQDGQQPFQRINDAYVIDWVGTVTPTFVLNVRASYNRFIEKGWGRGNEGFDLTSLGLPSNVVSALPQPRYFGRWEFDGGYTALGRYQGINITNNYSIVGSATKIWGKHTLKMGADLRRIHYIQQDTGNILFFKAKKNFTQQTWNVADPLSGDQYASFLLGAVSSDSPTDDSRINYPVFPFWQQWYFAPYIQDDWKVSRKLTFNLGLRIDYNLSPSEKYNRMNHGFDPNVASPIVSQLSPSAIAMYPQLANLKGGFAFAGVNGNPENASAFRYGNIQPRFGFAYQATERLVVRGGYGMYFLNPNNDYLKTAGFSATTPFTASNDGGLTPRQFGLSNPYPNGVNVPKGAAGGAATFVGNNSSWFDPNFKAPYLNQFSLGFQYQVSRASTLDISYVGSRSYRLNTERDYNIPSPEFRAKCNPLEGGNVNYCDQQLPNPFKGVAAFAGTPYFTNDTLSRFQLNRPFPQFSGTLLQQGRNDSRIWYNSLQVNFNQRIGGGLTLLGNYTFSKQMEQWGFNDPYRYVTQRGLYFLDRPHVAKVTAIYEMPFGKGKRFGAGTTGVAAKLISGWQLSTFLTAQSGEPADLPRNVIALKDPKVTPKWDSNQVRGWSPCVLRMDGAGNVAPVQYSLDQGCGTDTSKYAWLQLPSSTYTPNMLPYRSGQIRMYNTFTTDASLNKMTQITERLKVQFRAEAFNVFNHYAFPRARFNNDPNNANFGTVFPGQVSTVDSGFPRQIQIGIKVFY